MCFNCFEVIRTNFFCRFSPPETHNKVNIFSKTRADRRSVLTYIWLASDLRLCIYDTTNARKKTRAWLSLYMNFVAVFSLH